jgi:hypothetical protein
VILPINLEIYVVPEDLMDSGGLDDILIGHVAVECPVKQIHISVGDVEGAIDLVRFGDVHVQGKLRRTLVASPFVRVKR